MNLRIAACFAILLALIGKFGAVLQTIPLAVMGGISIVLFSMIAWIGVKTMKDSVIKYNLHSISVIVSMLTIGLGTSYLAKYTSINIGIKITDSVSLTGLSLAAFVGVGLNLLFTFVINKKGDSRQEVVVSKKAV